MSTTGQYKFCQSRVFASMARPTQDLDIGGVRSIGWMTRMRFYMVPLQIISSMALFACATFYHYFLYNTPCTMFAVASAAIPFGVGGSLHVTTPSFSHAWDRAIRMGSGGTFSYGLKSTTFRTTVRYSSFGFSFLNLFRAGSGTRSRAADGLRFWAREYYSTIRAGQGQKMRPFSFTRSSHGWQ